MKRLPTLILVTLAALLLAACANTPSERPNTNAELDTSQLLRQVTQAPSRPISGEALFGQTCAACHDLTSETKVGPGLADLFARELLSNGAPMGKDALVQLITRGAGNMPAIQLSDAEMDVLIDYLRTATR